MGHAREFFLGEKLNISAEEAKLLLDGGYIKATEEKPEKPTEKPKTEPKKGKG